MKNLFAFLLIATVTAASAAKSFAQSPPDWNTLGNNITGSEWFGADNTSTIDLNLRNDAQRDINFHTAGAQRMTLKGLSNMNFGGFPSAYNNTGYFGIGTVDQPLAYLHIGANAGSISSSDPGIHNAWRPWMKYGMYIYNDEYSSTQGDGMYVGLKQNEDEITNMNRKDAVISWGDDDDGDGGPDLFRILFTNDYAIDGYPENGVIEVSRYMPNGNVGIGNFSSAANGGTALEPQNRLDVYGSQSIGNTYAGDVTSLAPTNGLLVEGFTGMGSAYTNTNAPARQLDVFDASNPQLRLTSSFTGSNAYTDFQSTTTGNLNIVPTNNSGGPGRVGIHVLSPQAALDINGRLNIRVVDQNENIEKVLVWNDNAGMFGRVEWRDASGLGGVPDAKNAAWVDPLDDKVEWGTNPLVHDTEIPMTDGNGDDWSIYFSGQSDMQNYNKAAIGVGFDLYDPLDARLDLYNFTYTGLDFEYINKNGGKFRTDGNYYGSANGTNFTGVHGNCDVQTNVNRTLNIGGDFYASENRKENIGVRGSAEVTNASTSGASSNYGVKGIARQDICGFGRSYGVEGEAHGGEYAYGVRGYGTGGSIVSYGVYGEIAAEPQCGVKDYAGYFVGPVHTTAVYSNSDAMLKQNVEQLLPESALNIIDQLDPKTYYFDTVTYSSMALPSDKQYGLIAQDVEQVLPSLVAQSVQPPSYDSLGNVLNPAVEFKALNYTGMIPILIAAVKDLKQQNEELAAQLESLQDCCTQNSISPNTPGQNGNGTDIHDSGNHPRVVELSNYAIILDQNSPNPFAEKTTITYTIPIDVKDAQLIFSDDQGRVLKTVQIVERGQGSILVYASNLSSGIYTYSLIADSKLIDTKKMVCQK